MGTWQRGETLGDRLKLALSEKDLTQSELARRAGLSYSYVSMLVSGQRGARLGHVAAASIKRVLNVPDDFFTPARPQKRKQ